MVVVVLKLLVFESLGVELLVLVLVVELLFLLKRKKGDINHFSRYPCAKDTSCIACLDLT